MCGTGVERWVVVDSETNEYVAEYPVLVPDDPEHGVGNEEQALKAAGDHAERLNLGLGNASVFRRD